jgi:hypothetical protein
VHANDEKKKEKGTEEDIPPFPLCWEQNLRSRLVQRRERRKGERLTELLGAFPAILIQWRLLKAIPALQSCPPVFNIFRYRKSERGVEERVPQGFDPSLRRVELPPLVSPGPVVALQLDHGNELRPGFVDAAKWEISGECQTRKERKRTQLTYQPQCKDAPRGRHLGLRRRCWS